MLVTSKYTKSAKGQDCQIRIPGVCNFNPETTVLAHLNGGGMGMKALDIHGSYACSNCHDAVDGRLGYPVDGAFCLIERYALEQAHFEGVLRTQQIMIKDGVLKL